MTDAEIAEIVAGSIAREVVAMLEPMISRVVRRVVEAVEELRRATPPLRAQAAEERPEPIDAAIPAVVDARDFGSAGADFVRLSLSRPRGVDLVVPPLSARREYSDGASVPVTSTNTENNSGAALDEAAALRGVARAAAWMHSKCSRLPGCGDDDHDPECYVEVYAVPDGMERNAVAITGMVPVLEPTSPEIAQANAITPAEVADTLADGRVERLAAEGLAMAPPRKFLGLSPRESEIAVLLANGSTVAGISAQLGIARATAETYASVVKCKVGASSRAETIEIVRRHLALTNNERVEPTITDEQIDKVFAAAPAVIREVVESIPPARPGRIGTPSIHAPVQDHTPSKFVIPARTVAIAPSDRAMTAIARPLNAASLNPKYSVEEMAKAKARIAERRRKEAEGDAHAAARRQVVKVDVERPPINPCGTLPCPRSTWIF